MSTSSESPGDLIPQLNAARALVLKDATRYHQIVDGIMPLIKPSASLPMRRWGADFLAETLASPMISERTKEELALKCLDTLKGYLENTGEDEIVVKSVIQAVTSTYPLLFKRTIYHPEDSRNWQSIAAIKSNILKRMDKASGGVKMCCIKFIARVVQVQTPGLIADPRRPEQNELSLALVPRDHALIAAPILEAEASGLLDRLLSVFQDQSSDALLVTATLNCIGVLAKTRASVATKVLHAVLNFNPFKSLYGDQIFTPRMKVAARSMERTTVAFLTNLMKRASNHPMNPRIQAYLERLHRSKIEVFDETNRKRNAPTDPTENGQPSHKRPRLGTDDGQLSAGNPQYPPLPPPPISLAQLFTLSTDPVFATFSAATVPQDLLSQIIVPLLRNADQAELDNAINAVRSRYLSLVQIAPKSSGDAARSSTGVSSSDIEPITAETEQVINTLESIPEGLDAPSIGGLGPFIVPQPPPLTYEEAIEYGNVAIERTLEVSSMLGDVSTATSIKPGFNRLALTNYNRDSWMTVVSRIATRPLSGLHDSSGSVKQERTEGQLTSESFALSDRVRDALYFYILDDFRRRMDVAISWLNEEWYNDQVQKSSSTNTPTNYEKWALKLMDGIVPYLDAKDKVLIRFLSEIPSVTVDLLERVKKLADDPERVALAVSAIHYLILYRPPVREIALDAVEDLWRNYDDARNAAAKVLQRWRSEIVAPTDAPAAKAEPRSPTPLKAAVAA